MHATTLLRNARLADGRAVDLRVDGDRITSIDASDTRHAADARDASRHALHDLLLDHSATQVDLGGRLVVPALVNGHAHLDKTFVGSAWQPHRPGEGVPARVAAERCIRSLVSASVHDRARALADELVRFGTGTVRTHVDIDTEVGLTSLEVMLELREELADRLRVQVVAFPQSGILTSPGVEALLADALGAGADVIGGLDPTGFDGDADRHLDVVFSLAERHSVGVDIHLHDLGAPAVTQYHLIAERTRAAGLSGRVVVSHAYGLGSITVEEARRVGGALASAGVAVMTNGPAGPMPPVLALRSEGVTVFSGSDNIRDAWWPYGDGDMLGVARQVAYQSNFRTDDELAVALDLITDAAAAGIGLDDYGLRAGGPADLLVLDSESAAAAVAASPRQRAVMHAGRFITVTDSVDTVLAPPAPQIVGETA